MDLLLNGVTRHVDVDPGMPLLWVLRDELGLTGTKYGCGIGVCGACTVHLDGQAVRACVLPVGEVRGAITTIEGLGTPAAPHVVQQAWIQEQVVQCGYCQPGVMMQVVGLLSQTKNPNAQDIIDSMDDLICRCGTYQRMKKGIETAIQIMRKEGTIS